MSDIQQSPQIIYAFPPGMMMPDANNQEDEINLLELWKIIWAGKWIIVGCTFIAVLIAVFFALSQPNYYKSTALLAPVSADGSAGHGLSGSLGGLAALAGVSLGGGGSDKTGLALQILKSRKFVVEFVKKNNLVVPLIATKKWNPKTQRLEINPDVYNVKVKKWLDKNPSDDQIYQAFSSVVNASQDKQTSYVNLSVEFLSPVLAQQWVSLLVKEINTTLREKDIREAQKNIDYLQEQAQKTGVVDFQNVFYSLIQEQIKTVMFAEGKEDYVFEYIDPPVVPEVKSKPVRSSMVVLGASGGFMIALIAIFLRAKFKK